MFTFVTSRYLRITSSKLHSEDSWVVLPLLASGEMEDEEARGGGEAKYGGDRGTVWMLGQIRTVSTFKKFFEVMVRAGLFKE